MRIIAALILSSFLSFTAQAQSKIDPEVRKKVLEARSEAIRVMNMYSKNAENSSEARNIAKLMAESLESAKIVPAAGDNLAKCNNKTALEGGTNWSQPTVLSLCPKIFEYKVGSITQVLIHEAYHLYEGKYVIPEQYPDLYAKLLINPGENIPKSLDDLSEKEAAAMELRMMLTAYGCVHKITVYFQRLLNLQQNKDYMVCEKYK